MAYIGYKKAASTTVVSKTLATMTGDGSDTTLTLSVTPDSVNNVSVFLDGVFQTPGVHFTLAGNVITFTTAPASGVVVIALTGGGEHIGSPMAGSIKSADLGVGAVTSSKIASMDAAKLTGTYPALDASAVTGLTSANLTGTFGALNASAVTGLTAANLTGTLPAISGAALTGVSSPFTESASDPATNTNPSGGLGTIWVNTTSGEVYACTDATTDANVWTNVGSGTGNVTPWTHPGTTSGYCVGGYHYSGGVAPYASGSIPRINIFSFTTDGNATSHGDLALTTSKVYIQAVYGMEGIGASSATHGYCMGAMDYPSSSTLVEKFAFATINSAAEVGNIIEPAMYTKNGFSDGTTGFIAGGERYISTTHSVTDKIQTYSFASDTGADTTKTLTTTRSHGVGCQTGANAYVCGGSTATSGATFTRMIETFTFASTNNGSDVGDITRDKRQACGTSSATHGYVIGGTNTFPVGSSHTGVDKFQFAASVTSSEPFNLSAGSGNQGQYTNSAGVSSTNHGWACGEYTWPSQGTTSIEKITYASDSAAAHVGTLTLPTTNASGNQY